MPFTYLTRVDLNSSAAQARQIQCMTRAFSVIMESDFLLISMAPSRQSDGIRHRAFIWAQHPRARYLGACLTAASRTLMRRDQAVFTRDIAVAGVVAALGGHALYEAHKEPKGRFARVMTSFLSRSDRFQLVTISGALKDYYQQHYHFPEERCLVAHDGVFAEDYTPLLLQGKAALRAELDLPTNQYVFVHTGSLYKGGAETFGEVVRNCPDAQFWHIGGTRNECDYWASHYQRLGMHNLRFIPHLAADQVRKYQVAADALYYISTRQSPIYWCTSPLKLFEYMASGTPIVGARIGSVCEVLNDTNAFCFDPDQPNSIQQAVTSLMESPDLASRKAALAAKEARTQYSWQERARQIARFANAPTHSALASK